MAFRDRVAQFFTSPKSEVGKLAPLNQVSPSRITSEDVKNTDMTWDGDRGWSDVSVSSGSVDAASSRTYSYFVEHGWRGNPVVRSCIQIIAASLAEAPLRVYRNDADGHPEHIDNHPLEVLFRAPNRRDSYVAFIERMVQHYMLGGNVFLRKDRSNRNTPIALIPIQPHKVLHAVVDVDGIPDAFIITRVYGSGEDTIAAEDLIHFADVDPLNEVFGLPRLLSARAELATDNEASRYVNEVLRNHGTPGTVISVKSEGTNPTMLQRAAESWSAKFGRNAARGGVAFIPNASSVQAIGFNLKDLEFMSLRHVTRESLCTIFGVDPMLIGIGSAAKGGTLSGGEALEARRKLWMQTIVPLMERWEAEFNAFLVPDFPDDGIYVAFDTSEVEALQESQNDKVQRALDMQKTGTATAGEIRMTMGLDPDIPAGSLVLVPGTVKVLPVEDYGKAAEIVEDAFESDTDDEQDAESSEDLEDAAEKSAKSLPEDKARVLISVLGTKYPDTVEGRKEAWSAFDGFAASQENSYTTVAEDIYRKQDTAIQALVNQTLREGMGTSPEEARKEITPDSLDLFEKSLGAMFDEYHQEWRNRYDSLMREHVDLVAGQLSGTTGLSFDVSHELLDKMIDERLNLIVGADDSTHRVILDTIREGQLKGESITQLAERVERVFGEGYYRDGVQILSAKQRATLIARTESAAITNGAATVLLKTSELEWVKIWLSQGDDRVREEHLQEEEDSHNDPVPIKDLFRVTERDYPDEPNCRCSLLYELAD